MKLSDCNCVGIRDAVTEAEAGSDGQMASGLISPHPATLWETGFDTWSETLWKPACRRM